MDSSPAAVGGPVRVSPASTIRVGGRAAALNTEAVVLSTGTAGGPVGSLLFALSWTAICWLVGYGPDRRGSTSELGRTLSLDLETQFAKLVLDRRGGWCYEMNGVLAWALGEIGFQIRMVSGTVGRSARGDRAEGNHLVLIGELDQPYLVDVGFGDGPVEPLPLVPGSYRVGRFEFRLTESGGRWVLHNHPFGGTPEFDFTLEPRTIPDFATKSVELQTSPESGFVNTTVCQRYEGDGLVSLRGAVLRTITEAGQVERDLTGRAEYQTVLEQRFGIQLPAAELDLLWQRVWSRHLTWRAAL